MQSRRNVIGGALAGVAASRLGRAFAQTVDRQVHVIVGFAAGGGTDVSARLFAERIRGDYTSVAIVENKVGVAGRLSVEYVKNAPPDGAVMLFTSDFPITLYPNIYKQLSYDPLRDLVAVAPLTKSSLVLSVGPRVPKEVTNVRGFLDWCGAHPDQATIATTGAGGTPHFAGVMLAKESGVPLVSVHYRGGAPALSDLVGGHVAASFNPGSEAIALAQGGQIRMLGVANPRRSRFLPDTPTLREQGFDIAFDTWTGVFLPAKTPAHIVAALHATLEKAVNNPELIEAQARLGNEMTFMPQEQFAASIKPGIERWAPIVAASGFVAED